MKRAMVYAFRWFMDGQFSSQIPLLVSETTDKGRTIIKEENQMAAIQMYAFRILILGL